MDDYTLILRQQPVPGESLNCDTCVRSTVDKRQSIKDKDGERADVWAPTLDIAEDWCIEIGGRSRLEGWPVDPEVVRLLHQPLPPRPADRGQRPPHHYVQRGPETLTGTRASGGRA